MRIILVALLLPLLASALVAQTDTSRVVWQSGGGTIDAGYNDAFLTADGSWIVTAGDDGAIRVWSVREQTLPRVVAAHTGSVRAVVQLDDSTVVTAGDDGALRSWSWPELRLRREIRDSLVFTQLWRLEGDSVIAGVVSGYATRSLVTIDLANGNTSVAVALRAYGDNDVDVDPRTGRTLLVCGIDEDSTHVVDIRTGERLVALLTRSGWTSGDIAADGEHFVLLDGRVGRCEWRRLSDGALIDSATYGLTLSQGILRVDQSGARCLVFSSQGFVAFSRTDTAVTRRGMVRTGHFSLVRGVRGGFVGGSDTVWLAGTSLDGAPYQERFPTVAIVDTAGNVRDMAWLAEPVSSVTFIEGDTNVRVGTSRTAARLDRVGGNARAIDLGLLGYCVRVLAIDGQYESRGDENPESSISGRIVYAQIDGGYWKIMADHLTGVSVGFPAPGGDYHYYRGLWQREKDTVVPVPGGGGVMMFSYDATMLATGSSTGGVVIYRTADVVPLRTIDGPSVPRRIMFSRNGQRIAALYGDSAIAIHDVTSGELVRRLDTGASGVNAFAFSWRGTHLVVGSSNGAITVWDIDTGQLIEVLQGSGPVTAVDVTSDGRWIVSGSEDATVTMWRPAGPVGAAPSEIHSGTSGGPTLRTRR